MGNPVVTTIPNGVWTKVATNVLTGNVHIIESKVTYLQTFRLTGEAAPTLRDEGVELFTKCITERIQSADAIDVYVWCVDNDGKDGKIRVDV
jgi:hypothetical protein